ncbi:ATP-binding protein [Sediminibacterium sp.]|uniref:tetratricopeptide repeat-containing sensor histidine kinase n=1 Tax=Sediminibacterium sp. TaxID=1917865 RepID=UPI0027360222|nr:ATP-binding protein [Sediminibacterium sp.]MDP3393276.1 ATP-binding protein [Sediminibacterium sp.]MDP3567878.1 ATP-binding protein [Sediminibacterium sp.]
MKDEYKKLAIVFWVAFFFLGKSTLSAQTFAKDSIDRLLAAKGPGIERIRFLNNIAETLSDKNTQLAFDYAKLALSESEKNKQPQEKGFALNNLAWIKYRKGDFTAAFEYGTKALKWNDSIQNLPALAASYRCMASVYNSQDNAPKSIEYFLKDLTLHTQLNDQKSIGRALNNLSFTFLRGKMYDSALLYTPKALLLNLTLKDDYLIAFAYRNAGDLSEVRKLSDSAKYYFNLSVQYAKKTKSLQLQLTALYRIGRMLNSELKYKESIPYLENALQLGILMGAKSETALIYNLLGRAYEGIGNYKEAYLVQKKSSQLNDSLYQERSRSKLAEMQAKFEAEKKESEINELKKEKEQEIEDNQKKTILNFSLMITMIVVIVLLINIWRKNKYKTATNILLQSQKEALEETLLLKDKVFSIISHDLRSPIASLNAVLPMLDPDSLDHETYHQLKLNLTKQVQNLNYVLENLLIWSRSRMKGVDTPELKDINLNKQASSSIGLLKGLADQKKITIQNQINTSLSIKADPQHFDIIIRNILLNSIKFTHEQGSINLYSKIENDQLAICIEDNGVGMNPEQIDRLFQLKTHFTTPGTQKEKGTGLGLLICAEYAAANNWEIKVESQIGKGTIFTIILAKTNK